MFSDPARAPTPATAAAFGTNRPRRSRPAVTACQAAKTPYSWKAMPYDTSPYGNARVYRHSQIRTYSVALGAEPCAKSATPSLWNLLESLVATSGAIYRKRRQYDSTLDRLLITSTTFLTTLEVREHTMTVQQQIAAQLDQTKLQILVFGPAVEPPAQDPLTASLQAKRVQMRDLLTEEGHSVSFGEDVVDSTLPSPLSSPLLQEVAAMRDADFIVVLVLSPGSIAEAALITTEPELCRKVMFYCLEEHRTGLVVQHLQYCENLGAGCRIVSRHEVTECSLAGDVVDKVRFLHAAKAFLF